MVFPERIRSAIASNFGTHTGPRSIIRSSGVLVRTVFTFFLTLRTLSFSDYLYFVYEKLTSIPLSSSFNAFSAFVCLFLNHRKVSAVTGSSVSFFNPIYISFATWCTWRSAVLLALMISFFLYPSDYPRWDLLVWPPSPYLVLKVWLQWLHLNRWFFFNCFLGRVGQITILFHTWTNQSQRALLLTFPIPGRFLKDWQELISLRALKSLTIVLILNDLQALWYGGFKLNN